MKTLTLNKREQTALLVLAIAGLIIPNGIFLRFAFSDSDYMKQALNNPVSLMFIAEAFFLMFLFAWLIRKMEIRKPGSSMFIVLSLLGSMAFSVPAALYLAFKEKSDESPNPS